MQRIAIKYFEGRATDAELGELLGWLRRDENRLAFGRYRSAWEKSVGKDQFPGGGEESWHQLQSLLWQKGYNKWQRTIRFYNITKYAAIIFFVLSLGSLVLYIVNRPAPVQDIYTSVMAENGQISKVKLPDGSQVWLNSGSEISYNNLFGSSNRQVTLTGEAYFDVVTNKGIPLIVDCDQLHVKVYGTKFNVNAYSREEKIDVVLEEGKVDLVNPLLNSSIYNIKPG